MCFCAGFLDGGCNVRVGNLLGFFLILDSDRPWVIQQNTGCLDSGSNIRVGNPAGCLLILDSGQPFNDPADCVAVLDSGSNIRVENQAGCFLILGVWTVIVIAPEWFSKMPCHAGFSDSDSTHRSGQAYQQQICCTVLENKPATEDKWGRWPALMRRLGWCETRRKAVWRLSFGGCGVLLKGVCGGRGRGRGEAPPNKTSTQKVISFVCSFLYYYFYSKLIITLCFTATVVISLWLNMYFICYSVWDVAHAEMCKTVM